MTNIHCARAFALIFSLAAGCEGRSQIRKPSEYPPVPVSTMTAEVSQNANMVEISGVLEPVRRVALASKLPARVEAVHFEEGQRVKRNTALVRLDVRDISARRAQLAASRTSATTQIGHADRELKRMRTLTERGALPSAQLDEVVSAHDVALASLAGVNAQLLEVDANLANAVIRAPFAGVVVRRLVEVGQFAAPAQPLLVLEDDSTLRISALVSEAEAASVVEGQVVAVRSESSLVAQGIVKAVVSAGEGGTPGMRLVVTLENRAERPWRAGAIARISLPVPSAPRASVLVSVPTSSVQYRGTLPGVWVVHDGQAFFAWVRIASESRGTTDLASGVVPGESVVVSGLDSRLRDGLRVAGTL